MTGPWRPANWPYKRPRIAHFMPYMLGDSLGAIRRAQRLGIRHVDQNVNLTKDLVPVVVHWPLLRKNGLNYEKRGGRRRRHRYGPSAQVADLTWDQLQRLRTRSGRRVHRAGIHMAEAARRGRVLCLEVKGDKRFDVAGPHWTYLHTQAVRTKARVVIMTLQNLGGNEHARARLVQAADRGFPVALLPRMAKPVDWDRRWAPHKVAVWGRWR